MNTVTPFPTLTLYPTPEATPFDLNLGAVLDTQTLGPQAVQWWQMFIAPGYPLISAGILLLLVIATFGAFYMALGGD